MALGTTSSGNASGGLGYWYGIMGSASGRSTGMLASLSILWTICLCNGQSIDSGARTVMPGLTLSCSTAWNPWIRRGAGIPILVRPPPTTYGGPDAFPAHVPAVPGCRPRPQADAGAGHGPDPDARHDARLPHRLAERAGHLRRRVGADSPGSAGPGRRVPGVAPAVSGREADGRVLPGLPWHPRHPAQPPAAGIGGSGRARRRTGLVPPGVPDKPAHSLALHFPDRLPAAVHRSRTRPGLAADAVPGLLLQAVRPVLRRHLRLRRGPHPPLAGAQPLVPARPAGHPGGHHDRDRGVSHLQPGSGARQVTRPRRRAAPVSPSFLALRS